MATIEIIARSLPSVPIVMPKLGGSWCYAVTYCCRQRNHAWKGEAAGIAHLSERRCDSEALGLDLRPKALHKENRVLRNILIVVYLVIGVVVASSHHYFTHLNSLTAVLSALLAVLLWPLILFGVSLHIK
jgi:hypothetical protein